MIEPDTKPGKTTPPTNTNRTSDSDDLKNDNPNPLYIAINHSRLTTEKMSPSNPMSRAAHDSAKPEPLQASYHYPKDWPYRANPHDQTHRHQADPDQPIGPSTASRIWNERIACYASSTEYDPYPTSRPPHQALREFAGQHPAPGSSRSLALHRSPRPGRPERTSARMYQGSQVHDGAADGSD